MNLSRAAMVGAVVLAWSPVARAHDGGSELATLEKELDDQRAMLQTSDCQVACRALASIKRAADRICALEPGPRCDAARSKESEASRRVRDACPDCAAAAAEPHPAPPAPERVRTADATPQTGYAPVQESRGGCRSCAATDGRGGAGDLGMVALSVLAVGRLCRRRRR